MKVQIESLAKLSQFAGKVGKKLKGGETVALVGNLGAGKTTFTKMLLQSRGIKKNITSPTFVLMLPYAKAGRTFYHLDLYRIKSFKDVAALGVEQLWGK